MDMLGEPAASPRDIQAAEQAAAYVAEAAEKLAGMKQDLPALSRMDWRSPAAREFDEVLGRHIKHLAGTLEDLTICAAAVEGHLDKIRGAGTERH